MNGAQSMARINGSTRNVKKLLRPPKVRSQKHFNRKLNRLNFYLILGLYTIELDLVNKETLATVKTYTQQAWEFLLNLV